jgi:hypothetical protein
MKITVFWNIIQENFLSFSWKTLFLNRTNYNVNIKRTDVLYFILKNSIRYGLSFENENTSTIPRTENSPGSVIKSTL